MVWLSSEERVRFIDYLEYEAATNRDMIRQLANIGHGTNHPLSQKIRSEMEAAIVITNKLKSIVDTGEDDA